MSRSYKKPFCGDTYGSPYRRWAKRQASKTVRRSKEVPDGGAYRKFYDPYDITDYVWMVEKPIPGGKQTAWNRWISYEEMVRNYRRATHK